MLIVPSIIDGFDVAYVPVDGPTLRWPRQSDPLKRGQSVREAFAKWKGNPLDLFLQSNGHFDFSPAPLVFPGCQIAGLGRELTLNHSTSFDWDGEKRVAFQFSNGTILEQIGLSQASLDSTVDGICVGFSAPNLSATMRYVNVFGREWGIYSWESNSTLLAEYCQITAGRVCIAADDSGLGQSFTFRHSHIIGDMSLSSCTPPYDVSNLHNGGIFGLVNRGGTTVLDDVWMTIHGTPAKGQVQLPRAVGITDVGGDNTEPAGITKTILDNVRILVVPEAGQSYYDVDLQYPYTQDAFEDYNCRGSERNRSLRRSY